VGLTFTNSRIADRFAFARCCSSNESRTILAEAKRSEFCIDTSRKLASGQRGWCADELHCNGCTPTSYWSVSVAANAAKASKHA
jgi:hypothetical protein